jgi:hypothetical protein
MNGKNKGGGGTKEIFRTNIIKEKKWFGFIPK